MGAGDLNAVSDFLFAAFISLKHPQLGPAVQRDLTVLLDTINHVGAAKTKS